MRGDGRGPEGPDVRAFLPAAAVTGAIGGTWESVAITQCRRLYAPRVPSTRGVYLVAGTGRRRGAEVAEAWEAVLKVLAPSSGGGLPFEAFLYHSGFLATLPGPLVAPNCLGVTPLPGGDVGLWLERVGDEIGSPWPLAQYARTAAHLGALSGAIPAEGPAAPPWLPTVRLRAGAGAWDANVARLQEHRDHPLVRRAFPPAVREGLVDLLGMRAPLLDALERCPYLVCHGDAQRNNLFARRADPDGPGGRTVAIDWANFRRAPAGTDVATLVHQDLVFFRTDADRARELDRAVFDGYCAGLRAAGRALPQDAVRLAYALQLALVYGLHDLRLALDLALDERGAVWAAQHDRYAGRTREAVLDRRAAVGHFVLDLVREARALVGI